ncbi:nicotinamide riboside transporter PnuC [Nonlabens xiamenensis]|uniref:nicotinamide riboside transporter PnuC n=1 Tax=Nonlabens xiamenensis TaxID=2341043 RepID=UPI000F608325|nr:nicotinamide riboside transporter PnuC [Nonlabens xiamenensis]
MELLEAIFGQYQEYSNLDIGLEITAIIASLISVYFSFRNSVVVFPFGIISTLIYVYLLYHWNLLGDMSINGYYFIMSVYGWYIWRFGGRNDQEKKVTRTTAEEWFISTGILLAGGLGVYVLYTLTDRLESWISFVDMLTTGIFFAGMWLMARRKWEHWLVLALGNLISIPLYWYKGYGFSAILYVVLAIVAIFGFLEWKKYLHKSRLTV